jgi:MbtH protein
MGTDIHGQMIEIILCRRETTFSSKHKKPKNTQLMDDSEDKTTYKAVVNHEEQYSIWPTHKKNPLGWRDVGKTGTKPEVLAFIKEVWTDMRPLSLRKKMEEDTLKSSGGN